jgi:hypothetical protein
MIADDATAVIEKLVGCLKKVDELGYPIAAAHISNAIDVLRESQSQSLRESETN